MKNVVIIPTYNERKNIVPLIEEIFSTAPDIHIMVVDDNSPDKTYEAVRELSRRFPGLTLLLREKKEGLRKAYVQAFENVLRDSEVEHIIMMDADFSHSPKYIPKLLETLKYFDEAVGSRYALDGSIEGWETWRRFLSRYGNRYARWVIGLPVRDCTSGFNAMRAVAFRKINLDDLDMSGYAFLIELKYLLWKSGARITEVPILFKNRTEGKSKISRHIIKEGLLAPWHIRRKKV